MMMLDSFVSRKTAPLVLSALLLLICLSGKPCPAPAFTEASSYELGLRVGYGQTCRARETLRFYNVLPRWGVFLTRSDNPYLGKLRFSFLLEGITGAIQDGNLGWDIGFTPLVKISYPWGPVLAYIEGGAGVIWENSHSPSYAHAFNFSPQAGAGLDIKITGNYALSLAYRFRHTSNAGLYLHNPGVNSNFFTLGVTYYY
jgi:hypothetical protein